VKILILIQKKEEAWRAKEKSLTN